MKASLRLPRWRALPALGVLLRDLGVAGLAGLALLGAAVAAHGFWLGPAREEVRSLGAETARLRARRIAQGDAVPVVAPAEALRQFRARFPEAGVLEQHLGTMARLAREHRLSLASGDYRLVDEGGAGLARYEAQWPMRGQWRDLVAMLAAMLNAMPHASLDELVIKRESRAATEVEARVRVSFHFRGAPAAVGESVSRGLPPRRLAGGAGGG